MFRLTCHITVTGDKTWTFDRVAAVEIERSRETLTDTCRITLPKKVKWQDADAIPLKRGDAVTVELGYNGRNSVAFRGYITSIGARTPVVVTCEDEMWRLKNRPAVKKAYKAADLKTLLEEQQTGYAVKVFGEQNLGAFRVKAGTVAGLLDQLREQGVRCFFRTGDDGAPTLCGGVIFDEPHERVQVFDNRINLISDANLSVRSAADLKLRVKVVSLDANNRKTVCEVGDSDGEVRTLQVYGKSEAEARAWAEQELKRLKRDGLTGSFTTFGECLVDKLDTIGIVLDGRKKGLYQVEKNTIKYGTGGFRQEIVPGGRVDRD